MTTTEQQPGPITMSLRNGTMNALHDVLLDHRTRAVDLVVPTSRLHAAGGRLYLLGGNEGIITSTGVIPAHTDIPLTPTAIGESGLASKLGIPPGYLAGRCRGLNNLDLYDRNINSWLAHPEYAGKKYLVRGLLGDNSDFNVLRAFLSDGFCPIDCYDTLLAAMGGIQDLDVEHEVIRCDLSPSRMYIVVSVPSIRVAAPKLLRGYRNPFGQEPGDPVIEAGVRITNSDVGEGRAAIGAYFRVLVCRNGMTTDDEVARTHLGAKLDEGQIRWGEDTQRTNLALIRGMTRDAVAEYLTQDYLDGKVAEMERKAGIEVADPEATITVITRQLNFSKEEAADVMRMYIRGGQATTGGVMHAVTAAAQLQANPDRANEMESLGFRALDLAYTSAR